MANSHSRMKLLNQYRQRTMPNYAPLVLMNLTANHANHADRKNHPRRGCSRGSSISRFTASGQCSGNLTNDGTWTLTWDAENRLVKLAAATGVGPQISLQFDYDHQGRRIRQRVWNNPTWSGNPTNDVRYVYDGWNLLASLNPASAVPQAYLWGLDLSGTMQGAGGVGGLLAITDASQGSHFCAYDGNGNVTALVKADGSGLAAQYEYGPFGEPLRATGPMAKANPFRFSTKYQDDETDLLYYGYRYYNPSTGRWPNGDPINELGHRTLQAKRSSRIRPGDGNLYDFVHNNPISKIDPDGRNPIVVGGIIVGVGVGLGYCIDNLSCRARVAAALINGESEADRVAPDGSTHRGATAVEGGDADALTHCIAACNLGNHPYPCFGADGVLNRLQARETGNDIGTQIDRLNNEVGIGIGVSLGKGENCTTECLNALRRGLLNEIRNGQIVPSSVE